MDIKNRLKERQDALQNLVERINALAGEREQLVQEALRMEGEIRLLKKLEAEKCEPTPKKEV
jgi:hypothetical protein